MDWFRVDVRLPHDPKIIAAGLEGHALFIGALAYSAKQETDGFVPSAAVPTLSPLVKKPERVAVALVDAGLWEETPRGYQIPRWTKHNPTHAEMEASRAEKELRREQERERKADWRRRRAAMSQGLSPGTSHGTTGGTGTSLSHGLSRGLSRGLSGPGPVDVPLLDTGRYEDGTLRESDLELTLDGQVPPEGGSGGEPDHFVSPENLTPDEAYLWGKLCREHHPFRSVWPGVFEELIAQHGHTALLEGLRTLSLSDLSEVSHPRAYLIQTVAEKAAQLLHEAGTDRQEGAGE